MDYLFLPNFLKPKYKTHNIRVGRDYDGGYIISKKALDNSKYLYSFGLYDDWSFEENFLQKNKKVKIFIFDGSINFIFWIKYLIKSLIQFIKNKINFIQLLKNYKQFFLFPFFILKKKVFFFKKFIIGSKEKKINNTATIIELINKFKSSKIFFKIDIEGNEYKILEDILKIENLIECLVIEFHDLNKSLDKVKKFIKKCKLRLVHIHVNNYGKVDKKKIPSVIELTFVKKNYCSKNNSANFPIKNLDFPNNKLIPDKKIKFKNL